MFKVFFADLCIFLPELLFLTSLFYFALHLAVFYTGRTSVEMRMVIPYITITKLTKMVFLLFLFELLLPSSWLVTREIYNGFLVVSPTIIQFKCFLFFLCFCILKSHTFYLYLEKQDLRDFYYFFGFLIFFLALFLHINDFFLLFFTFEIISIILYILIIYQKKYAAFYAAELTKQIHFTKYQQLLLQFTKKIEFSTLSIHAGIVYFISNAFFSGLFLCGSTLIFFFFKHSNFAAIFPYIHESFDLFYSLSFFMSFCLLIFFLFKLAIVPFHWWLSPVFDGASILILFFISIPLKSIFFLFFFKLTVLFFSYYVLWLHFVLVICSLASIIVGSFGLFGQVKLKKFWAFSTINHMGYLLLALTVVTFLGFRSFFVYFLFYININFSFFMILQGLYNETLNNTFLYTNQLNFLTIQKNSILGFCLLIILFSLIGIPPFLGFWGKYLVICAVYQTVTFHFFCFIFIIIVSTTLVTAYAYLQLWRKSCFTLKGGTQSVLIPFPLSNIMLLGMSRCFLVLGFFFFLIEDFFFIIDCLIFYWCFDL